MAVGATGSPEIPGLQFVAEIGRGSFGRVYKAVDTDNGRHVAVKVVLGTVAEETTLRQFDRERRAAGALSAHPNIVTVHRSGLDEAGRPYLVMELAQGGSLAERLRQGGTLGWAEAADIGVKLAGAVETAHRIDVVHCDIKPENILLGPAGEPLLADFGIARVAHAGSSSLGRAGTFAYSAPEVFKGDRPSPASDVFALGATLYALMAGSSPFMTDPNASQESVMYRIVTEDPPSLRGRGVPDALADVVETALRKDPSERFPSAAALGHALQQAQGQLGERPTNLVVEDVVVPDDADAPGTVLLQVGQRTGPLSSASALGRVRPPRHRAKVLTAVLGAVLLLGAVVVAARVASRNSGRGPTELVAGDEPAGKVTTTLPPATTAAPTTAAPLPRLAHHSAATDFLGTRVERDWELPDGQAQLEVTVTLTNISDRTFRWHHDELVPASLTSALAGLRTEPAADATFGAEGVVRWWHELPPNQRQVVRYRVERQPSWPAQVTGATLAAWDGERAQAATAREQLILSSNNLTNRAQPPGGPASPTTAAASPPPNTAPAQIAPTPITPAPTAPAPTAAPAPVPPTVSISGPAQLCAGARSTFTGTATGAVSGTWSLPGFTIFDPSWTPGAPTQWVEPGTGAIGSTFTWTLQVVSGTSLSASAHASFSVIDCTPTPSVSISGPDRVCVGATEYFSGVAQDADSGTWALPGFNLLDASWSPDAPTQWVSPAQFGTYTWTLTVSNASGRSASASKTFLVNC